MNKAAKKWKAFDFNSSLNLKPAETKQTAPKEVISAVKVSKNNPRVNFLDKLKPQAVDDLAVHPKKIQEVEDWLNQHVINPQSTLVPILLITGPTGCGKTATVNILCKVNNINVSEWINPSDQDYEYGQSQAQVATFLNFFTQTKYNSLIFDASCKSVTLVEDFPNFVTYNPGEFTRVLEQCQSGNTPVIFICTDVSNSKLDLAQTLFSQETKEKFNISTISFNPCSATLLKNVLKRTHCFIQKCPDLFSLPSSDVLDAVVSSTMGDIRCAVNQYQFACIKGTNQQIALTANLNLNTSQGVKRKRKDKPSSSIKSMARDEVLGFFHGLGRVLNPKHSLINNSLRIQCDFDVLIDQFSSQPATFSSFLQENYLKYFGDLLDAQNASDILSLSQVFLNTWIDHQEVLVYALWVSVLGLMVNNNHKVSKWNQIRGPKKVKKSETTFENRDICKADYLYYNIITKSDKFATLKC